MINTIKHKLHIIIVVTLLWVFLITVVQSIPAMIAVTMLSLALGAVWWVDEKE